MADNAPDTISVRDGMIADLQELVRALDRRLPRVKHLDEPAIAKQAAVLREQAIRLLEKLQSLNLSEKN